MKNCRICSLYSGSRGNSVFISAGGAKILIDAGKSAKSLCLALKEINVDITEIDAIFITHEHKDHTSALQTLSHKHSIPIYMLLSSARIFDGLNDQKLCECLMLQTNNEFEVTVKDLTVKAFPTPHDSLGSVGFRLTFSDDAGNKQSIGYATDLGYVTDCIKENMTGCFAIVIESNHNVEMLKKSSYPIELKERIFSKYGHLSNSDCADLAGYLFENGTKNFMLMHLSQENNTPSLAYDEIFNAIASNDINLRISEQDRPVWLVDGHAQNSANNSEDVWRP